MQIPRQFLEESDGNFHNYDPQKGRSGGHSATIYEGGRGQYPGVSKRYVSGNM